MSSNYSAERVKFGAIASEVYERQMGRWSRRLRPLFLDFVGFESSHKRILDAGCGTGCLTYALAERYAQAEIHGCDIADELLSSASSANRDPDRVSFDRGDICVLPYEDGYFDAALSSLVVMFVPDAQRALSEMARVTRPAGVVGATTWDFRGGMPQLRMLLDTAAAVSPEAEQWRARLFASPGVRPGHLGELMRAAGLVEVREGTLAIRMEFANCADYWEPSRQSGMFGALYRSLPSEAQTLIQLKVRSAYLAGDEDGPRSFTATAWAATGIVPDRP